MDVSARRVTVMGLGRHGGGVGVVRYLVERGARVTVTDRQEAADLRGSLAELEDLPATANLRLRLGGHDEADFRSADVVVVNPAVPPGSPLLDVARNHGAEITTEMDLFLSACRAPVIGVTGTNGKSTTTTMIADMLRADGRRSHLGGNIGRSLLPEVERLTPDDWVVLELSSFQLARLRPETPGVYVAVVTNCTPNHLDWHGSFAEYAAAKQRLLTMQRNTVSRSANAPPSDNALKGKYATDGRITPIAVINPLDESVRDWTPAAGVRRVKLIDEAAIERLELAGQHNRQNALLAATAAEVVGCSRSAIDAALANFSTLPHRLQIVGEVAGLQFIDDSQSTTPESVVAAVAAVDRPVWLLAGGYDKGADFAGMIRSLVRSARGAHFFGATARRLTDAVLAADPLFTAAAVETFAEAFRSSMEKSRPGDCVLLSPGCASFDQFRDCDERAAAFVSLVEDLRQRDEAAFAGPQQARMTSTGPAAGGT